MKNIRLTEDVWYDYFEVSTLHKEVTCEFADGDMSSTEWIKSLYDRRTKAFAKKLLRECGTVKKTRTRLRRFTNKLG